MSEAEEVHVRNFNMPRNARTWGGIVVEARRPLFWSLLPSNSKSIRKRLSVASFVGFSEDWGQPPSQQPVTNTGRVHSCPSAYA